MLIKCPLISIRVIWTAQSIPIREKVPITGSDYFTILVRMMRGLVIFLLHLFFQAWLGRYKKWKYFLFAKPLWSFMEVLGHAMVLGASWFWMNAMLDTVYTLRNPAFYKIPPPQMFVSNWKCSHWAAKFEFLIGIKWFFFSQISNLFDSYVCRIFLEME